MCPRKKERKKEGKKEGKKSFFIVMHLPTLMGSLGGWVSVVNATRGGVGKFIPGNN